MSARRPSAPHRFSVSLKLALVSWAVTIFTLLIFVAVIVPEQKRIFQENLSSKARGLSASLQDVIAGAAITEDYSAVVDHCRQVLQGDDSIDYIVVTKNDGFSLIHESAPGPAPAAGAARPEPLWRQQWLGDFWHPALRQPASSILRVPVFDRRVFQYASPFDYSGIEWGWINVGLSVRAYDRSVATVYSRTGILAVICILSSLIVSILYARHLVRPIKDLQEVQLRVSRGDLAARAAIHSGDEVETLADSFNAMTETLQQRDRILECVRLAAQRFLMSSDWEAVMEQVLANLGQAAQVCRIEALRIQHPVDGGAFAARRYAWFAPSVPGAQAPADEPEPLWLDGNLEALAAEVQGKGVLSGLVAELDPALGALLRPLGFASLVLTPIAVDGVWWGVLCMGEYRRQRRWTQSEEDSLRAVADMLGATITRHRTQAELLEAKETLEQRVLERTEQLRRQMAAKVRAHADLAAAQHLLVDLSRQAGMAEVATGVLHNVGNVLNSVNVSTTLIRERLRHSEVSGLVELRRLLEPHQDDPGTFLSTDPRGPKVLPYLFTLTDQLQAENLALLTEQDQLIENIDHIKEIVRMQQSYATVSGYLEPLAITDLVEHAIRSNSASLKRHGIEVARDFADFPKLMLDKHKVLQILINLVQNAKHALVDCGRAEKRIAFTLAREGEEHLSLAVRDNGIGIPRENLTRIFSHGFSTRKGGHGFGLHVGALAAEEMGGQLRVESEGAGLGATFILTLPMHPPAAGARSF